MAIEDKVQKKLKDFESEAKQFELYLAQLGYVKAVRCKNCQNSRKTVSVFGMPITHCMHFNEVVYDDDWCSHGEPR